MPKIRVTKHGGFKYGVGADRKQYGLGKELIVKQKDARTLVAARLAEIVDDGTGAAPAPKPKAKARTTAAKAKTPTRKGKPVAAAGRYNRRDMKAK